MSPVKENEQALLELLNKDEENFPTLEASAQVERTPLPCFTHISTVKVNILNESL